MSDFRQTFGRRIKWAGPWKLLKFRNESPSFDDGELRDSVYGLPGLRNKELDQ